MNIPIKPIIRKRFTQPSYVVRPRMEHEGFVLMKKSPSANRRPLAPAKPPMRLG